MLKGFKHKYTYFLRTIPDMKDVLHPIEETIRQYFILAITGGHLCSDDERVLLSLPVKLGGLGISILTDSSDQEYNNSRLVTEKSTNNINQNKTYDPLKMMSYLLFKRMAI